MSEQIAFWIIAAIVLGVIEACTVNLVSIWFCISALITAVTAYFTPSWLIQWIVFGILSLILFAITKPFIKKFLPKKITPTNADRIIGMSGVVTEDIDPIINSGRIEVAKQSWSAKCDHFVPKGAIVTIEAIEGVKAVVAHNYKQNQ